MRPRTRTLRPPRPVLPPAIEIGARLNLRNNRSADFLNRTLAFDERLEYSVPRACVRSLRQAVCRPGGVSYRPVRGEGRTPALGHLCRLLAESIQRWGA